MKQQIKKSMIINLIFIGLLLSFFTTISFAKASPTQKSATVQQSQSKKKTIHRKSKASSHHSKKTVHRRKPHVSTHGKKSKTSVHSKKPQKFTKHSKIKKSIHSHKPKKSVTKTKSHKSVQHRKAHKLQRKTHHTSQVVLKTSVGYNKSGYASWYGGKFNHRRTSSGKRYNMQSMTAASMVLPLGSRVKVTNLSNKRSVYVEITDRGPFAHGRIIDVSYAAAKKLGFLGRGITRVNVQRA